MTATLISAFEVPPDADEAFLAGREPVASATLYRALRSDVDFRFVSVARVDAAQVAAAPSGVHASLYEVVGEEGAPDGSQGVTMIEPVEVPAGADEQFLAAWRRSQLVFSAQRGFLGTRLHRSLDPQAELRFVNVGRWSSPLMFFRASRRPDVEALPFRSHPALYVVAG